MCEEQGTPLTYKIITQPSEVSLYKEKGSKFYGMAIPVRTEDDIKKELERIKSEHYKARHWCYAWRLGVTGMRERANDDGEPSHSAGEPILGQIHAFGLTNVLVVVVRYFGGVKLGVGGLIRAYKTAAHDALSSVVIHELPITEIYELNFGYEDMNSVRRVVNGLKLNIISSDLRERCVYRIEVPLKDEEHFRSVLSAMHKVQVKKL